MPSVTSVDPCACCGMMCSDCNPCAVDPDPGCCTPCPTPDKKHITILAAVASSKCTYDTANHFHVHKLDVSLLVGRTFQLDYIGGCCWSGTFDVTAWARVLQCIGDGTGCVCTPTTDITASSTMTVTICRAGGTESIVYLFHFVTTDTELDNDPAGFDAFSPVADPTVDPAPCCSGWVGAAPGEDVSDPWNSVYVTSAGVVPC